MSGSLLECQVREGMFSDESVVVFTTIDGEEVSFFVPKSEIEDGHVRVRVFEDQGNMYAVIPNEDQSIIPIPSRLVAA